ncbi:MAG: hypothetical protein WA975_07465 [Mesorhizobium sp.]
MKAYFVRKTADHEVVGLFVASSAALLAALVDECCDPATCDYALASMGGLMVPAMTSARWPLAPGSSPEASMQQTGLEEAVLSQQWEDDLGDADNRLEWHSLKPAALRLLRALEGKPPRQPGASRRKSGTVG